MKIKFIFIIFILFSVSSIYGADFNPKKYEISRKDKDNWLRTGNDSPIPQEQRKNFKGLDYFAPTKTYIFKASFVKFSKQDTVKMLTSKKEKNRQMLRWGNLSFVYKGKTHKVTAYISLPLRKEREMFIPFTDVTTGYNSYEAGRYLDIPVKDKIKKYILDFNEAYNPYCAYNKNYSCPLVPPENHIPIEIQAGEKYIKKKHIKK